MKSNVILSSLSMCIFINSCLEIECETKVMDRQLNKSLGCQALVTSTDCGATTSESHVVRISNNLDTNINGDHLLPIAGSDIHSIDIRWISEDTLLIQRADTINGWKMPANYQIPNSDRLIKLVYQ